MKILKIFGIVVGIHVFALILIFANPGCSSTTKTAPSPGDTAAKPDATPAAGAPSTPSSIYSSTTDSSAPPVTFNPDAPAAAAPAGSTGSRMVPTRPGTPVAGVLIAEPIGDVTPATPYTVKSGDNLWTIAKKNNITVPQLTAANNLAANASLRPGQKLLIPGKSSSPAAMASGGAGSTPKINSISMPAAPSGSDVMKHTVKSGETLGAIARKYGVRQGDIATVNNITDPAKIRPGMELVIPGWDAKSGKSTPKATNGAAKATSQPAAVESPATQQPTPPSTSPAVPVLKIDEATATPKQP